MSLPQFDSPYRDDPPVRAPASRDTVVRPAPTRAADAASRSAPRARDAARADAPRREPAARREAPRREAPRRDAPRHEAALPAAPARARQRTGGRDAVVRPAPVPAAAPAEPSPRRRSRRRRGGEAGAPSIQLTSHPTGRAAYAETRAWLLAQHGPVCAYCGRKFTPGVMTLDHVAPRRGQSAYDRRDNLVLACPGCNAAKRDLAPLAFLLGSRPRAANLLRYGAHLSHGLLELARSLVPEGEATDATVAHSAGYPPSRLTFDDDSPYAD